MRGTDKTKVGLAEMLVGGAIMDVVDAEQARIAEDAGAVAVMALERVPPRFEKKGGWPARSTRTGSTPSRRRFRFPSWPSAASVTSWRPGFSRPSRLISSTRARC